MYHENNFYMAFFIKRQQALKYIGEKDTGTNQLQYDFIIEWCNQTVVQEASKDINPYPMGLQPLHVVLYAQYWHDILIKYLSH